MSTDVSGATGGEPSAASGNAEDQATLESVLANLSSELEHGRAVRQSLLAALLRETGVA